MSHNFLGQRNHFPESFFSSFVYILWLFHEPELKVLHPLQHSTIPARLCICFVHTSMVVICKGKLFWVKLPVDGKTCSFMYRRMYMGTRTFQCCYIPLPLAKCRWLFPGEWLDSRHRDNDRPEEMNEAGVLEEICSWCWWRMTVALGMEQELKIGILCVWTVLVLMLTE